MGKILLTFFTVIVLSGVVSCSKFDDFVDKFSRKYGQKLHHQNLKRFNFLTKNTDSAKKRYDQAVERYEKFLRQQAPHVSAFKSEADSPNKENRNAFHTIASFIGTKTLSRANEKKLKGILNELKAQCPAGCEYGRKFSTSQESYNELLKEWDDKRQNISDKMKGKYNDFVKLSNSAVRKLGYNDIGEFQRARFGPGIEDELKEVFEQLRPLYEQVHALIRRKLKHRSRNTWSSDHIPAHLLWETWEHTSDHRVSFGRLWNGYDLDINIKAGLEKTYKVDEGEKLYKFVENFFKSIKLTPATKKFWKNSVFGQKHKGCRTTPVYLYKKNDVRISECQEEMGSEKLREAYDVMSIVHYFQETTDLKHIYRDGPYPEFVDVVVLTIDLFVYTPQHLRDVHLYPDFETDNEKDINELLFKAMGLDRLMFRYVEEKWRWGVFRGDIKPRDYNNAWWKLRCEYQGLAPSSNRTAPRFDPGIYIDIANNEPQIGKIVPFILKFQFLKAMCDAVGHTGPLFKCDIGNSITTGSMLKNMMEVGGSEPLSTSIMRMTGQPKLQAQPLLDYFQPLMEYLQKENGDDFGWENSCP